MRKNGFLALGAALVAVGLPAAPALAATASGAAHAELIRSVLNVTHLRRQAAIRLGSRSVTISKSATASTTAAASRGTSTPTGAAAPRTDPPPAQCTWKTTVNVTGSYVEGALASTTSTWVNNIDCLDGKKNTSMRYLRADSELYLNSEKVSSGDVHSCVFPNKQDQVCKYVSSVGTHLCKGAMCAGVYQAIGYDTLELPAGWIWPSAPKTCVLIDSDRTLVCGEPSGDVTIPPTD